MKKLVLVLLALLALSAPATAAAHPLGNFTINRYAELVVSGSDLYVRYALDVAEIPTLQEGDGVSAARIARNLVLTVDGRRAELELVRAAKHRRPGAGGLDVLRLDAVFRAPAGRELSLRDRNYEGRIGWREVVVRADGGARVERSTAPATSVSDALRAYPQDRLRSPLGVSGATATVEPGTGDGVVPGLGPAPAAAEKHGFEALIAGGGSGGAAVVLLALLVAAFWGAAHALTPGHGKAIVAGYIVGARGTPRHAVALGLIVTVTHTIGVFALGLVTLALSELFLPEQLYPWLTLASGLLVVAVGLSVLWSRGKHGRAHRHGHDHHHHHGHDHGGLSRRNLLGIGISAGIIPCPSALVVLLSAIALHRIGFGLALIVAFSVGLAATITGIGLVAVYAQRAFGRLRLDGGVVGALPAVSAAVIVVVGLVLTARALPGVV